MIVEKALLEAFNDDIPNKVMAMLLSAMREDVVWEVKTEEQLSETIELFEKMGNAFSYYYYDYEDNENKQIECTNELIHNNHRIYISKGGVITGEYVEKCIIRPDIVDKHSFTIQSIPNIPVCIIFDKDNSIYVVDHREPKLKALQQFYDVPINKDEDITNKHYNLRKYDKIK